MTSQVRIDDRYDVSSDAITGGFGRIWRAHDRTSGREVSLQIVPIKDLNISISNFARDLQLSARLKHPIF